MVQNGTVPKCNTGRRMRSLNVALATIVVASPSSGDTKQSLIVATTLSQAMLAGRKRNSAETAHAVPQEPASAQKRNSSEIPQNEQSVSEILRGPKWNSSETDQEEIAGAEGAF
jgi:hypothetical protein